MRIATGTRGLPGFQQLSAAIQTNHRYSIDDRRLARPHSISMLVCTCCSNMTYFENMTCKQCDRK